jgi:SAM-dependent MidA family methyltransferase
MTTGAEAAIRAEIARRGPIPFADFMALALGHPDGGYYASVAPRPTRAGDFLTAPELHPIFGAALARQVDEAWERVGCPEPFALVEYGAGSGTLALAILAGLRADGSRLAEVLRYAPVELNPHRRAELEMAAAGAGLPVIDAAGLEAEPAPGVVLANEYLDALPVHALVVRAGRVRELHVRIGCNGAFEEVEGEPAGPDVVGSVDAIVRAGVTLVEGQRLEVRPLVRAWAVEVARRLAAGLVLVLDYGAPVLQLYGPRRLAGSLMTYRGHAADGAPDAPYRDIGERDITAHVDTTSLANALTAAGLDLLGGTSQAELLVGCGLEELVQRAQARASAAAEALELRGAVMRLLDPRHLGGFCAVLAGRGISIEPPLRGLSFRMPGRR